MGDDLRTWMMRVFLGVLTLVAAAGCLRPQAAGVRVPALPAGTTAAIVVRGHPTPPAEARKRQGALGRPAARAEQALTLAAPPPPFPLAAGSAGAGYVSCPPAPGAAYTACYAWSYQPDADEPGEPWQTAGVCLYKDSDPLVTVPQIYGGEYWYECPQFCGAHYAARCQAISTPGTGYNGTCHSSCAWVR